MSCFEGTEDRDSFYVMKIGITLSFRTGGSESVWLSGAWFLLDNQPPSSGASSVRDAVITLHPEYGISV